MTFVASSRGVCMSRKRFVSLCTFGSSRYLSTVIKSGGDSSKVQALPFHHSQEESKALVTSAIRKRIAPAPTWKRLFSKPQINTSVNIDVSCAAVYWPLWVIDMRFQCIRDGFPYFVYEWNAYNLSISGSDSHATRVFSQIPLSLDLQELWEDLVTEDVGRYKPWMNAGQEVLTIPWTAPPTELGLWALDEKDPVPYPPGHFALSVPTYHAYPIMVPLHAVKASVSEGEHRWELLYIVRADQRSNGTFFCVGDPNHPRYLPEASNCESHLVAYDMSYSGGDAWDTVSFPLLTRYLPGDRFQEIIRWVDKKRESAISRKQTIGWHDTRIGRLADLPLDRAYDHLSAMHFAAKFKVSTDELKEKGTGFPAHLLHVKLSDLVKKQCNYLVMAKNNCLMGGAPELYKRLRRYEQKMENAG
ncbi:hypothetical protein BS47DRAFT_1489255 [Hydnum rufescens UP504]|uniref:Uncharacterized protein n=1 Tax=Hydnum rufescens UP504 TaxID=1448309 RepID=A0A9P6DQH6_9AGAM|nr:hypothetical protein BS47DRAFT_1489255 [Hydnum rufescens UP504]